MKKEIIYRMVVLMSAIVPCIALIDAILSNECVMMSSFALGAIMALAGHRLVNKAPLEEEKNSSWLYWAVLFALPIWSVSTYRPAILMLLHYYLIVSAIGIIVCLAIIIVGFLKKKKKTA